MSNAQHGQHPHSSAPITAQQAQPQQMGPGGIPIAPASPTARDYQNTLMHCVLSGARSFEVLLAFADFGGSVDTGKSSACMPVLWDGQRDAISRMSRTVLLMSVYKDRWRSDDNASLRRHPIYIARTVQNWMAEFPETYGVSACLPLASAEANINLAALKTVPGIGSGMRKFLSEQLKDKDRGGGSIVDPAAAAKKTYRVRLAVFERAKHNDFYKWARGEMWGNPHSGGFEGFRKTMFEIVWALSVCQSVRPGFKHNDLHAANVLITSDAAGEAYVKTMEGGSHSGTFIAAAGGGAVVTPTPVVSAGWSRPAGDSPGMGSSGLGSYLGGRPHVRYTLPSRGLEFAVPCWPARALLADFDFAWLPGHINQKVCDFESDDSVWGVSSVRDDHYDMFMVVYHLYITHFEQLLERDQGLMAEIFARCRSIYKALYNGPPDGHNLARTVLAAGGGFVAGIDTKAVAAGYTHMSEGERQELLQMYHVGHINHLRTYHLTRDQMVRLWAPQADLREFMEWVVPARFFGATDKELIPEGIHRWRYNETFVTRGGLGGLHTPAEVLAHPYFAPYVRAAGELASLSQQHAAATAAGAHGSTRGGATPSAPPSPVAVYVHPSGSTSAASAPSSLIAGGKQMGLEEAGLPVGLTSPARGGAGASTGIALPLAGVHAATVAAAAANGYHMHAGADTAREAQHGQRR